MLDDHRGRGVQCQHAFQRGVGVGEIVVGERPALKLSGAGQGACGGGRLGIKRGALMRIFAIAQCLAFFELGGVSERVGERFLLGVPRAQIVGDIRVVTRGQGKGRLREPETGGGADAAVIGLEFGQHRLVVGRIAQHGHGRMIFSGGAQQRGAADVDIFERLGEAATGPRHGGLKGVQVDHEQIDRADAMRPHDGVIRAAPPQQAGMDARVQGLDAAVHHLREAGIVGDFSHPDIMFGQQAGRAARGQNFNLQRGQGLA